MVLIQFLLDSGSDPNIMTSSSSSRAYLDDSSGTTLDRFAPWLAANSPAAHEQQIFSVRKRLVEAGAEFSKPLRTRRRLILFDWCQEFLYQISQLREFDDQVDRKWFR